MREAQKRKQESSEVRLARNEREREAQKRKRESSEVRLSKNEREREPKRKKRESQEVRQKRNEREMLKGKEEAQKRKRESSEVRLARNEREREAQKRKRESSEVRLARNEREREPKRRKRESSEVRLARNEREREAQKRKRESSEIRIARNEREREAQKRKRESSEVRLSKNEREREPKRKKRESQEVRQKRNERECDAQRKKRKSEEIRQARNERSREAQKRKQESSEVRLARNERKREAQKRKRESSEVRLARNEREREAQKRKRESSEVRLARNEREQEPKRRKRESSEVRLARNEREREAQKRKRESSEVRQATNERLRVTRKKKRSNFETSLVNFKREIRSGPSYICTICNRLLYRTSVKIYKINEYPESNFNTAKISFDGEEYVCMSCHKSMKAKMMPSLAVVNGLHLDEIPQQLAQLNSLESVFIARRIPFMKILVLPRGKQKAIHGCVVNVPIEPEQLVSVLPQVPTSETFITVKVKRKLTYRGHVFSHTVRPRKVRNALRTLKHDLKNPLYDDVIINEHWMEECMQHNQELWESLTDPANAAVDDRQHKPTGQQEAEEDSRQQTVTEQLMQQNHQGEHVEEVATKQGKNQNNTNNVPEKQDQQVEEEVEDERSKFSGLPFDSCIQPKDHVQDSQILNIAPGEGKRPQSFFADKHAEELSFPQLFPRGRFGFSYERHNKLSLKKYFQARVLNCDRRFAKNIDYLFYAQYRAEAQEVNDSISLSLRKGRSQDITAGEVKEKCITRDDLGIYFLHKIRGSPAYFNKLFYDILGMIRQLGPCTWFITLSAADLKWPDLIQIIAKQQGQQLTDEDVLALSWEEKSRYLRSDPVTAARHFDTRVQLFFKYILINKQLNPLGDIVDYKYRIEYQLRGSPHVHMLAWVKDAPNFEQSDENEIRQFIDDKISSQYPEDDAQMSELLHLVQRHTHSVACRKHGNSCRFNFPRPPVKETMVFKPLESPPTPIEKEMYSKALTSVYEHLQDVDQQTSLDDVLNKAKVSEDMYLKALHWKKTKGGQPAIILKRKPYECNINNYNVSLMKSWEANLDVQFVTNVYSCVMYLASYVSKPEKTLGDVLKAVSKSSHHLGTKQAMKNVAHKFLTHREISAQEAVYRLLSLPLTRGSRQVVFIPTNLPENQTRLLKPMAVISTMDDDDPDVYQKGLVDKYAARPDVLDDMCLADFASNYKTHQHRKASEEDDHTLESENTEPINQSSIIKLKDDMGNMSRRNTPAIIRSHQWSLKKKPEEYYHAHLMLYFPWRNEAQDLCQDSYKQSYESKYEKLQKNREMYEHHTEQLADALQDIEENGFQDDNWVNVAPQAEQARIEETLEGRQTDQSLHNALDTKAVNTVQADTGTVPHEYDVSTENVSSDEWIKMIMSLNMKQWELHNFIVNWSTAMALSEKPKPFHIFLTGGAGVGKSFLVRTIVQTVKHMFARNGEDKDGQVLVCAPTGAAAYNIAGHTCHAAFQLPVQKRKDDDYIPLSTERLTEMKAALGDTKLIVIDEVSMVGADMLLTIHRRLCDVKGSSKPFGGVSIIAVGDLMQLPAVAQKPIYVFPSDEIAAVYGSLWTSLFKVIELTEIQRQKDDQQFAQLLNRVRIGNQTEQDLNVLKSRQTSKSAAQYPVNATHMFVYNKMKDEHNSQMLEKLSNPKFCFKAVDSKKDVQTQRIDTSEFSQNAGGLPAELTVAVEARVVLTKNIDVSDGLVNSAVGTVTGFLPSYNSTTEQPESFKPKYILIKFDEERVGRKCRFASRGILPDQESTPISTVETPVYLSKRSSKVTSKRVQFPLSLAWGVTIHKEQGKTEECVVVSCKGNFMNGQFYTAISRTKDMDGLHFLDQVKAENIKVNRCSLSEMQRIKEESPFTPHIPLYTTKSSGLYFKLQSFNINSLKPHAACYFRHVDIAQQHILCLQETWLIPQDPEPEIKNFSCIRKDNKTSTPRHRHGGLLMYIRHDLRVLQHYEHEDVHLEYQKVLLSHVQDDSLRLIVISLYNNPRTSTHSFLKNLEILLQTVPENIPTFICGDFNIDMSSSRKSKRDLIKLSSYYGFCQHVQQSTHCRGGVLDLLFTNRCFQDSVLNIMPAFYSDHMIVSFAVPFLSMMHQV